MKRKEGNGLALMVIIGASLVFAATSAQAGPIFNFYGEILLDDGNTVSGEMSMQVKDFDQAANGTKVYESASTVKVTNGDFLYEIGGDDPQDLMTAMATTNQLWLEFVIDGQQLDPRVALDQHPFALHAADTLWLGGRPASDYRLAEEGFSQVAKTGKYADLTDKPALSSAALSGKISDMEGTPTLAAIALDDDYNQLADNPNNLNVSDTLTVGGDISIKGVIDAGDFYQNGVPFSGSPWDKSGGNLSYSGSAEVGKTLTAGNFNVSGHYLQNGAPLAASPWQKANVSGWVTYVHAFLQ